MKVIAFNGSGRKDGNTYLLLKTVLEEISHEGIGTEIVQMAEKAPVQVCTACMKCMEKRDMKCAIENDPFNDYFAKIAAADALLLGSPVYFSDITAGMKINRTLRICLEGERKCPQTKSRRGRPCSAAGGFQSCIRQPQLPVSDHRNDRSRLKLLEYGAGEKCRRCAQ